MKEYDVKVPITGFMVITVDAENEEDAIEKALEYDYSYEDVEEWSAVRKVSEGNVFYGYINEAEVIDGFQSQEPGPVVNKPLFYCSCGAPIYSMYGFCGTCGSTKLP